MLLNEVEDKDICLGTSIKRLENKCRIAIYESQVIICKHAYISTGSLEHCVAVARGALLCTVEVGHLKSMICEALIRSGAALIAYQRIRLQVHLFDQLTIPLVHRHHECLNPHDSPCHPKTPQWFSNPVPCPSVHLP